MATLRNGRHSPNGEVDVVDDGVEEVDWFPVQRVLGYK